MNKTRMVNRRERPSWMSAAGAAVPSLLRDLFIRAHEEGCLERISIMIEINEWHLAGRLCGMLGITPGQWFVGCAMHTAICKELRLNKILSTI